MLYVAVYKKVILEMFYKCYDLLQFIHQHADNHREYDVYDETGYISAKYIILRWKNGKVQAKHIKYISHCYSILITSNSQTKMGRHIGQVED